MTEQLNALHNILHCLNAYGYFRDEIAQYMPITGDTVTDVKLFFKLQDEGHKELKAIRQRGKPATLTTSVFIRQRISKITYMLEILI